jgi:hypothetical protein
MQSSKTLSEDSVRELVFIRTSNSPCAEFDHHSHYNPTRRAIFDNPLFEKDDFVIKPLASAIYDWSAQAD